MKEKKIRQRGRKGESKNIDNEVKAARERNGV
jgi:hypothetical protein